MFESRISAGTCALTMKKTRSKRNLMPKQYLHGPMTWKVMRRNAWKDSANMRMKLLNKITKSRRHAWMTINLKKKKMSQLENYLQFAHTLF